MAKSKSYGGFIVLALIVAGGGVGAWYYFNNKTDKQPEYQTTKVSRGDIVQTITATGDLQPVVSVDVSSQISGQVKEVLVDFNSQVKAGDVLARIDPATYEQRLMQAQADLASAKSNNQLIRLNAERTRELFAKKLVSQQELDNIEAQLSQSDSTMLTRTAAIENAKLDLARCTITAPLDGMVLDRKTDKGRTVAASLNAPVLFTLVNDLTKMQINAAVAEADIGTISEKQDVKFTVDAFPNRTFAGTVRQVRNAASTNQSVVSYATIIDVNNDDLKLKPGMTANVSIIVALKNGILTVQNSALRVRLPQEIQAKVAQPAAAAAPAGKGGGDAAKGGAPAAGGMTDEETRRATFEIMQAVGFQRGSPASPEMIEKAKALAVEKKLDPDLVAARFAMPGGRGKGKGGGGGGGGGGGSGSGFSNTVVERTLYKIVGDVEAKEKKLEAVRVRLGISNGFGTEVLDGLAEGDVLVTSVVMPGAPAPVLQAPGGASSPFGGGGRGGMPGMSGGSSGGMRRGG